MVSLFLLLGCNLSYIVDLFAALHELASASARTLLKLASSMRALLKPHGDTLTWKILLQVVGVERFHSITLSLVRDFEPWADSHMKKFGMFVGKFELNR